MKKPRILGVTGTVQTGKMELEEVFRRRGWVFRELNDVACESRVKGTLRHQMYNSRFPGSLNDEGLKTAAFYTSVTRPFYRKRLAEDIELTELMARRFCTELPPGQRLVLSWEYLAAIAPGIPFDHVLLFTCERARWLERIRSRLRRVGWQGGDPSDDEIKKMVALLGLSPERIHREIKQVMSASTLTVLDMSFDDWGAARLDEYLGTL